MRIIKIEEICTITSSCGQTTKITDRKYHGLSNSILAGQIGFSEVYFRKVFKKQYGISPKQYILNVRIKMAKQLLSENLSKISEISERCGFSSVYHFSRAFSSRVGMTPSEYAKQNKFLKIKGASCEVNPI